MAPPTIKASFQRGSAYVHLDKRWPQPVNTARASRGGNGETAAAVSLVEVSPPPRGREERLQGLLSATPGIPAKLPFLTCCSCETAVVFAKK